jgi:hypothetical protein
MRPSVDEFIFKFGSKAFFNHPQPSLCYTTPPVLLYLSLEELCA